MKTFNELTDDEKTKVIVSVTKPTMPGELRMYVLHSLGLLPEERTLPEELVPSIGQPVTDVDLQSVREAITDALLRE